MTNSEIKPEVDDSVKFTRGELLPGSKESKCPVEWIGGLGNNTLNKEWIKCNKNRRKKNTQLCKHDFECEKGGKCVAMRLENKPYINPDIYDNYAYSGFCVLDNERKDDMICTTDNDCNKDYYCKTYPDINMCKKRTVGIKNIFSPEVLAQSKKNFANHFDVPVESVTVRDLRNSTGGLNTWVGSDNERVQGMDCSNNACRKDHYCHTEHKKCMLKGSACEFRNNESCFEGTKCVANKSTNYLLRCI